MAEVNEAIYTEIPVRTWRWLGVNEGKVPAEVFETEIEPQVINLPQGAQTRAELIYRTEKRAEVEINVADGASLELVKLQLLPTDQPHGDKIKVILGEGSTLRYTAVEAGASVSATEFIVELQGEESVADVAVLYFGDEERRLDLNYILRQAGKRTEAKLDVRGALTGKAEKVFRGTLDFLRGASDSVGREKETVMLLSDDVRNRSIPLMLSGEGDVDGYHAVSIGKMDEEKLFYLMSRGLDLAEAQRLVVEAALAPVLQRLPQGKLAAEVNEFIQGRLGE